MKCDRKGPETVVDIGISDTDEINKAYDEWNSNKIASDKAIERQKRTNYSSENNKSYKDTDAVHKKYENCGHNNSEHEYSSAEIDYRIIIPLFFKMVVFAVVFALLMRYSMFYMGVSV